MKQRGASIANRNPGSKIHRVALGGDGVCVCTRARGWNNPYCCWFSWMWRYTSTFFSFFLSSFLSFSLFFLFLFFQFFYFIANPGTSCGSYKKHSFVFRCPRPVHSETPLSRGNSRRLISFLCVEGTLSLFPARRWNSSRSIISRYFFM